MADFGGGFFGGILNGLASVFGFFKGLSKAIKQALFDLALKIIDLAKGTVFVFRQVARLLRDTGDFFVKFARTIFPPLLTHIHDWAVTLAKTLQKWFGPLVRWIQKKRKWLLDFWKHHVQPVLDVVDIVRRVLRIAGKLHVPGATSIDQKIAAVENKITAVFHDVIAKINEVLNWVNRIVTADGILQEVLLLTSIDHWKQDILLIQAKGSIRELTPEERAEYDAEFPVTPFAQHVADMRAFARGEDSLMRARAELMAEEALALIKNAA